MTESTVKKRLLQEGLLGTPAKILVCREINSWMETNEKPDPATLHSKNNQMKLKVRKYPPKYNGYFDIKKSEESSHRNTPNIE